MKFRIQHGIAIGATTAVLAATTLALPANGAPSPSSLSANVQVAAGTKQAPAAHPQEAKNFYKAFWFATGPSVKKLSAQIENDSFRAYLAKGSQAADVKKIADTVANRLEKASPGYLADVHARMASGDVLVVEQTMKETSEKTLAIMNELYPTAQKQIETAEASPSAVALAALAVAVVVVWSGAVVVNYAGAVNVAGAVNAVGWFNAKTSVNVSSFSAQTTNNEAINRDSEERMTASIAIGLSR